MCDFPDDYHWLTGICALGILITLPGMCPSKLIGWGACHEGPLLRVSSLSPLQPRSLRLADYKSKSQKARKFVILLMIPIRKPRSRPSM